MSKLDELLLRYSQAAGGSSGRAILILESDIPTLIVATKDLIKELARSLSTDSGYMRSEVIELDKFEKAVDSL